MKFLTIVRHGKADLPASPDGDYGRRLTKGGRKQVKRTAKMVRHLDLPVDLIVSSPADRARETAELLASRIGYERQILWRDAIYEADARALLSVLKALPEDSKHVALVGHNPGLRDLISGLCTGSANQLSLHLRSGGLAHLNIEVFWWNQIRWGCGNLQLLARPQLTGKKGAHGFSGDVTS